MLTISLRPLRDDDLDALFHWESDADAVAMAAFTRDYPADRQAFDAHYRRVRAEHNYDHRFAEIFAAIGLA